MLKDVGCGVSKVFIFTDYIKITFRIFVEDDALLKVDCVLFSFEFFGPPHCFTLINIVLALTNALVDH